MIAPFALLLHNSHCVFAPFTPIARILVLYTVASHPLSWCTRIRFVVTGSIPNSAGVLLSFDYRKGIPERHLHVSIMADEAQETNVAAPPKVYPVTAVATLEDFQTRIAVQENVTAVLFWSKENGALSGQALTNFELTSDDSEFASTISFLHVDVSTASSIAKYAKVSALPTTQFYFDASLIEEFSGINAEKVKLMAKNAVLRRVDLIKESEAREVEAAAAAAAAAENEAGAIE
jgi:hypothetical protein